MQILNLPVLYESGGLDDKALIPTVMRNDRWFHSQIFANPLKKRKFEKGTMSRCPRPMVSGRRYPETPDRFSRVRYGGVFGAWAARRLSHCSGAPSARHAAPAPPWSRRQLISAPSTNIWNKHLAEISQCVSVSAIALLAQAGTARRSSLCQAMACSCRSTSAPELNFGENISDYLRRNLLSHCDPRRLLRCLERRGGQLRGHRLKWNQ
jgi:hypothetical protein